MIYKAEEFLLEKQNFLTHTTHSAWFYQTSIVFCIRVVKVK